MQKRLYSIYDIKAQIYIPPFVLNTHEEAIRAFRETVNNKQTSISKHPEDYTLFYLGEFENTTCEINTHSPTSIARGHELINQNLDDQQMDIPNLLKKQAQ